MVAMVLPAAAIPEMCRQMLGNLAWAADKVGVPQATFQLLVKTAGYDVSRATMHRWRTSVHLGLPVLSIT